METGTIGSARAVAHLSTTPSVAVASARAKSHFPISPSPHHPISFSAFTLIEVCIAVAVAGFALVTLLVVLGDTMIQGRRASDETKATLIQQRIMRDLRSQPFGSSLNIPSDVTPAQSVLLTTSNAYTWSFGRDLQYLGTGSQTNRYFIARLLTLPDTNAVSLTRITLTVAWIDGQPRATSNTLHTWVGRR